jgi:hypothetical protein
VQTYRTAATEEKQEVSCGMQQQQEAFRCGVMILTRRSLVSLMGAAMALTAAASPVIAASIPLMVEPDLPRFRKTPSGVRIQGTTGSIKKYILGGIDMIFLCLQ